MADRQLVAAEIPKASQCCSKLPGAGPYATTGAIGTPGPGTVLEATGEVYALFAGLPGGRPVPEATLHDPVLATVGGQNVGALLVLAVRKGHNLYVVTVNRSPTEAVSTTLQLNGSKVTAESTVLRLDGASPLSYNTAAAPEAVHLTRGRLLVTGSNFAITFPAHSVTTLRMPLRLLAARYARAGKP